MKKRFIRTVSGLLVLALLFSITTIASTALTLETVQMPLPEVNGQVNVAESGSSVSTIVFENEDTASEDFAFSPVQITSELEESQHSVLESIDPDMLAAPDDELLISGSDKDLAAVGGFNTGSGYLIDSSGHRTDIWVEVGGNTLTLSGRGAVPSSAFADSYYGNNTYNLIIKGDVTLSAASFFNLYNLRSVSFQGTLSDLPENAFYACTSLRSIELPAAITHIGRAVFGGCTSLTDVTILSPNADIDDGAFIDLDSLQRVSMPNGVRRIGYAAFWNCDSIENITIGAGLTEIEDYAFASCHSLKTVSLPDTLVTVGDGAFGGCSALQSVNMPSAKTFGAYVFELCTELKSFTMPPNLESTGGYTFNACEKLESVVLSDKLSIIADGEFFDCYSLKQVDLPDALIAIGNAAFYDCRSLEKIEFPDNHIMVYAYAFSFCNQVEPIEKTVKLSSVGNEGFINTKFLKRVEFSPETSYIGVAAFQYNTNLVSVDFNGAKIQFDDHAFFGCEDLTSVIDPPQYAYVGPVAFHQCPGITEVKLSTDCQGVFEGAFYSCENLQSIDFNGAAFKIGHHAFTLCDSLVTVLNAQNVTGMDDYAFAACYTLSDASGFTGVSTLEEGVFYDCTSLRTAAVGDDLKAIGVRAFRGCTSLTDFSFPEGLETIGDYAFVGCDFSGRLVLPANVENIGIGAFGKCNKITEAAISAKVAKLDDYVFLNCEKLASVAGAVGVEEIGYAAFADCKNLTNVSFGPKLKKISDYAFEECEKLGGLGSDTSVEHVGRGAFRLCKNLRSIDMLGMSYIGQGAFCDSGVENVVISSDMEYLGDDAFELCENLRTVRITGTLDKIGDEAFALCTSITEVELPAGLECLGNLAFYGCDSIRSIDLPDSLKEIGNAAFYQCSSLESVVIPDSAEKLGYSCFKDCTSLKSAVLSDNLSVLETAVFYGCSSLAGIEIPQGVQEIGFAAFAQCGALDEIVISEGLLSIGQYAFWNCKRLKAFDSPSTIKSVGDCAFADCEALIEIALPSQVRTVGNYVFYQCYDLETVYLSGSIIGFGISSFYRCEKLKDIYLFNGIPAYISEYALTGTGNGLTLHYNSHVEGWSQPQWKGPDDNYYHTESVAPDVSGELSGGLTWTYYSDGGVLVIRGSGPMDDYDSSFSLPWYSFLSEINSVIIEDGVTAIGARAFADCIMLRNVTAADTVTSVGDYAFANCDSLVYCGLSSQISEIGDYAFYQCKNLDIDLPPRTEIIGNYAFYGCTSVSKLDLPDSIREIGEGAFYRCSGLSSIVLPKSMDVLRDYTFRGCASLESIVIPAKISSIGKYSLGNCDSLESVYIYGTLSIGDYAFAYSRKLKNLVFFGGEPVSAGYCAFKKLPEDAAAYRSGAWTSDKITAKDGRSIPCSADPAQEREGYGDIKWKFYPQTGLLIVRGTGAMSWDTSAQSPWSDCKAEIRAVIIEDGVASVGANAFKDCTGLNKAVIADTVNSIGENAFANCVSLKEITFPRDTVSLGNNAFSGCTSLRYAKLPDGMSVIPSYAFANCENLQSIISGNNVNKIGYSAFYGCELLDSFTVTGDAVTVEDWAFARCGSLTAVNGSQNITEIGEAAFFGCESLNSFTLNDNITAIPDYAFAGAGFTGIALPYGVRTVGERAFWGSALESVDLDGVTGIGEAAFFETQLKNITIPSGLTSIGRMAFAGIETLYSFTVDGANPSYSAKDGVLYELSGDTLIQYPIARNDDTIVVDAGVRNIGEGAFYSSKAENIELPDTVCAVGAKAFAESRKLTKIMLTPNLTHIEESAFANCKALERVYLRENIASIGANAFRGCEDLARVYFEGDAPQSIGKDAFSDTCDGLTFVYGYNGTGWTPGVWRGPDGLDHSTKHEDTERFVCSITFELDGGTIRSGFISRYLCGEGALLPTDAVKDGYRFAGWYENEDLSGEPVLQISEDDCGDKTFYAKWKEVGADTPALEYYSQSYDSSSGNVKITFSLSAAKLSEPELTLLAAAYDGKRMLASSSESLSAPYGNNVFYTVAASGKITTQTVFKVMLLSGATHAPLTENLTVKSNYSQSGSGCTLSVLPHAPDNPNPDVDPGDEEEVPPKVDSDLSYSAVGASNEAELTGELSAVITLSGEDLQKLLTSADRGKAGGADIGLTVTYGDKTVSEELTSDISLSGFDSSFGYLPSGVAADGGIAFVPADDWLETSYDSIRIASKNRAVCEKETGVQTAVNEHADDGNMRAVSFCKDGERILRLRGSGYISAGKESALIHTAKNVYTLILPYYGLSNIIDLDAQELLDAIVSSKAASGLNADLPDKATISFVVDGDTYAQLRFEYGENGSAAGAELLDFRPIGNAVSEGAYNPIAIDESYEPVEGDPLTVEEISPSKGSNGKVTVKISGSMMEASAKPSLTLGSAVIEAEKTYWFTHDRMYATFDLTNAEDGVYSLKLDQKDDTVTLDSCFTVDSSLPKGELSSGINIDKSAKAGESFDGSVTFTNIGYTDVYAPVVYIDTANLELRENENTKAFSNRSVFVRNDEGLAGIIANGETAAYNFLYKIKSSQGFTFNLYNYSTVNGEIDDIVVLNEDSAPADYLEANLQALIGVRAPEYAENIAKMACQLASLGDKDLDLSYLENAFYADAQGILIGDSLIETVDIASRDLSLSRYYTNNVMNRKKEGTFGVGWFSDLDAYAVYNYDEEDDFESLTVNTPYGITVFLEEDGILKESIYGKSTAEFDGSVITVRDTDGSYVQYSAEGKLLRSVDAYGDYTEVEYNENGKPAELRNNQGDSLIFEYTDGNLTGISSSVTNDEVVYSYDDKNRLTSVFGMNGFTSYAYEDSTPVNADCLTSVTSDTGVRQTIVYDDKGRVTELSYDDARVMYSYEGANIVRTTDQYGSETALCFNAAGNLARAVGYDGTTAGVEYGKHMLGSSISSGLSRAGSVDYDDSYNISSVTGAEDASVDFTYDSLGNITSVTDRGGKTTVYSRDSKGETTQIEYPDGSRELFTYDDKGNVITETRRDGSTVTYTYNELSYPILLESSSGDAVAYSYDSRGNRTEIIENGKRTYMEYNLKDELVLVRYPSGATIMYSYDNHGNLIEEKSRDGMVTMSYSYEYDKYDRLTKVFTGTSVLAEYSYNPDGSLHRQTNYNGTYTEYSYDKKGVLTAIYNRSKDGGTNSFFEYAYDESGNIISVKEKEGTWTYGYDTQSQLTKAAAPNGATTLYSYDYSGNRTSVTTGGSTVNYNSNSMNQYTAVGSTTLSYDANGNLIASTDAGGTTAYEYDYADRLTKVTEPNGRVTRYEYDAFGLRSSKGVTEPGEQTEAVTDYINSPLGDGYTLVEHTGNQYSYYFHGNGLAARVEYNTDVFSFTAYNYSFNHLGSTAEITDEDGGIVNSYSYDQEGKVTGSVEGLPNDLTYVGKYGIKDEKNGLYYDRARYVSSKTMSFTSPDPIGQISDLNLYRYANNNPACNIDITGNNWLDPFRLQIQNSIDKSRYNANNTVQGVSSGNNPSLFSNNSNPKGDSEYVDFSQEQRERLIKTRQQRLIKQLPKPISRTLRVTRVVWKRGIIRKVIKPIGKWFTKKLVKKLVIVGVGVGVSLACPVSAPAMAAVVNTYVIADTAIDVYHGGKWVYDNRETISGWYNDLKYATGEAVSSIQKKIDDSSSVYLSDGYGSTTLLKGRVEENVISPGSADVYEYTSYYGDRLYPDSGTTVLYGYAGVDVFRENIYTTGISTGPTITESGGVYAVSGSAPRVNLTDGYNNFLNGMKVKYGPDYVDPFTVISTPTGGMIITMPTTPDPIGNFIDRVIGNIFGRWFST